jgi:hypothetical protein
MRRKPTLSLLVFLSLFLAVPLLAQRGGGRRGGTASGATMFENRDDGIAFPVPPDVALYTAEMPGRFTDLFKKGYIAYMVGPFGKDITIGVREMPGATEADLKGLLQTLETNPPQAAQPGFKKISVGTTKVGDKGDKDAVDFVYDSMTKDVETTTRQLSLVHKGKGFTFSCISPAKDFQAVNKKTFDALFDSLRFN